MSGNDGLDFVRGVLSALIFLGIIAAIVAVAVGAAMGAEPTCTPALITIQSYDHGTYTLDGCLAPTGRVLQYTGARDGLILDLVSPDNLDGDGIFRNGFEVTP